MISCEVSYPFSLGLINHTWKSAGWQLGEVTKDPRHVRHSRNIVLFGPLWPFRHRTDALSGAPAHSLDSGYSGIATGCCPLPVINLDYRRPAEGTIGALFVSTQERAVFQLQQAKAIMYRSRQSFSTPKSPFGLFRLVDENETIVAMDLSGIESDTRRALGSPCKCGNRPISSRTINPKARWPVDNAEEGKVQRSGLAARQAGLYAQFRSNPTTQKFVPQPMPIMPVPGAIE